MKNLLLSEFIKNSFRRTVILSCCIIAGLVLLYSLVYFNMAREHPFGDVNKNWKEELAYTIQECEENIAHPAQSLYPELDKEMLKAYQYMADHNIQRSDWQYAILSAIAYKDETERARLWEIVGNEDWRAYVSLLDQQAVEEMNRLQPYNGRYKILLIKREEYELRLQYGIPVVTNEACSADYMHRLLYEYISTSEKLISLEHDVTIPERVRRNSIRQRDFLLYRIKHSLPLAKWNDGAHWMVNSFPLMMGIGVLAILFGMQAFAIEYKFKMSDQFKMSPCGYGRLLGAKYIYILALEGVMMLALFALITLYGAIVYRNIGLPEIALIGNFKIVLPAPIYTLIVYILKFVEINIYILLAIYLIQRKLSVESATVISIVAYILAEYVLATAMDMLHLKLAGYLPIAFYDLSQIFTGVVSYASVHIIPALILTGGTTAGLILLNFKAFRRT